MRNEQYIETFDEGPCGWVVSKGNFNGYKPMEIGDSTVGSRSPWWIDYNHAPPGAGYLHMLACLNTAGGQPEAIKEVAGTNRFIAGGYPTDFTNSRVKLRIKGELLSRGAELILLIQGVFEGICSGWLLTGQPFNVANDWSEQVVSLVPDPAQWTGLGSRHDRTDTYGLKPLEKILSNVNVNIMLVMFPLEVVPMGPIPGDPHILRAGMDYPVWTSRLPEGYVLIDEIRIDFENS